MTGRERLLLLTDLFGKAHGLKRTTVSWRLFEDTNRLDAIESGKDLYLGRYERALQYLSDYWPDEGPEAASWPAEVPRPPKNTPQAVAEAPPEAVG